jgi:predicted ATPase
LEHGLNAWREKGSRLSVPYFLALEAEAHEALGQFDDARTCVAEAQTLVHRTGERWWLAELYRLEGGLLLASAGDRQEEEAETCFQQALGAAREQQAKSLELRAPVSLSRLWQRQGKRDAAAALLGEISHWFTEEFTIADLQEANALLKELGG